MLTKRTSIHRHHNHNMSSSRWPGPGQAFHSRLGTYYNLGWSVQEEIRTGTEERDWLWFMQMYASISTLLIIMSKLIFSRTWMVTSRSSALHTKHDHQPARQRACLTGWIDVSSVDRMPSARLHKGVSKPIRTEGQKTGGRDFEVISRMNERADRVCAYMWLCLVDPFKISLNNR